jgi:hypothetical protein
MKTTNKQVSEFARTYSHLLKGTIKSMCEEYKTERGLIKALEKANAVAKEEHERPLPDVIEIELTWRRSTYGNCPRGLLRWRDSEGWHTIPNACFAGGWGYDKTSTIVAECLNMFPSLRWSLRRKNMKKKPYGIYKSDYRHGVSFDGGIGVSCYYRIAEWMGYKMTNPASTDHFDKFVLTRKGFKK